MAYRFYVALLCLITTIWSGNEIAGQQVDTTFTCNEVFRDNGGPDAPYSSNQDVIHTFCPDSTSTGFTRLRFFSLDIGSGDQLEIFDGADITANLLGTINANNDDSPLVFQASAFNNSRCLTVRFQSNDSDQGEGWEALVECIDSCQNIIARVDSTSPGIFNDFIDVCPGERIFLFGNADYPENGIIYEHSNINSVYVWDFGDGSSSKGQNTSHIYYEPGGYTVTLKVIDPFGCESTNIVTQKIRVAPAPTFEFMVPQLGPICIGDTVSLNSNLNSRDPNSTINVLPLPGSFSTVRYQAVEEAIPDGTPTPLESSLLISDFNSGQSISNANQIESICVNIEHSRVQDLDISLQCPDGTQIDLHQNSGFTIQPKTFGTPILGDEGRVIPGQSGNYCWTLDPNNPSINELIDTINQGGIPEGNYRPEEDFANLVSCPLNGEWKLIIRDTQVTANGYLFNWSIDFREDLFPNLETFTPNLVLQAFEFDPSMVFYLADTIAVVGEDPGYQFIRLEVTNTNQCVYDTTIQMGILPEISPLCTSCDNRYIPLPDTFICVTDSLQLGVNSTIPSSQLLTFKSDPNYSFGFSNHPPNQPYPSQLLVQGVAQDRLTNPISQIESICLNINSDFNEDIAIFLRAPNGQILELSTNNGGGFDNYFNTCFSPSAFTPITIGTPPFSGSFAPEGNWSDLRDAPINGVWELLVSDAFDPNNFGQLVDWEITFRSDNEFDISWSPAEGLSCTDCATPKASPTATTTYQYSLTDRYGCTFQDEFTVQVLDTFPAPEIICGPLSPGNMIFNWNSVGQGLQYEGIVTINGVDSTLSTPISDTFLIVGGLVFDDEVRLRLNVVAPDTLYPCFVGVGESTCVFEDCFTFTQIENIVDVTCFGEATGEVSVEALRGFRPFTYYLNGDFIGQQDSIFSGLTAGDYQIVTEDMTGCSDTLFFQISQPDPILTNLEVLDTIQCFGDSTSIITASAMGGTGALSLSWNYPLVDSLTYLDQLPAGNYVLSVEDEFNCMVQDSVEIIQPDSINIQTTITPISCANDANGSISVNLSGGTGTLDFEWSTGINDTLIINLPPDTYSISVTDQNGCFKSDSVTLSEPTPLVLDTTFYTSVSCFGSSNGEAEVLISGGTTPYNYAWQDSLSQTNMRATNLRGGLVDVLVTDDNGCLLSLELDVPEPDSLDINFTPKDVSCRGGSDASAIALVNGGTRPYQYNWQNGRQDSVISNLVLGNYSLTVTDQNGCIKSSTVELTEPATDLVVNSEQSFIGCFNEKGNQAIALASGGGDSSYSFLWSDGQTSQTAIDLDSISYTVTVTDANGCERSSTVDLVDQAEMNPNMIINAPSCFGSTNGAIGINFIEGRPNADLNTFQFVWNTGQQGPTINNLVGDSLYTVTVTDPDGCTAVESRLVRQPKLITFQLVTDDASCFDARDGAVEITNISADTENFTYLWDERTGNQTTSTASNLSAGVYTVTITDEFGCFNIGQATVEQPSKIDINFKKVDNTCFGDRSGALSAVATGGIPDYRFAWSNGILGPDITDLFAGNYTVTVTDNNNCFQVESVVLDQPEPIDVSVETQDVSCFGDSDGSITIQTNGGAPPYLYSRDLRNFNGSPILIGLTAGDYNVTIRDANGCTFVTTGTINEPPPLIVDAGPEVQTIFLGDSITLTASAENGQGPITFEWVEPFPDALPCLFCEEFTVAPDFTVSYELIGLDSAGCQANDFTKIFVKKEQIIDVPTGFTPNNDNNNDALILHGKPGTFINVFRVYDRLGELVHEATELNIEDPLVQWDGLFNGEPMPQDTYIWFIDATFDNQVRKVFRGQTTLIR